jgi:hypothetical protein
LKDKLGTRGLPTGEIELLEAEAVEVAPPPRGFKLMMEALEYSRIHNAVGAAGIERRALTEALAWCEQRQAFGHKLIEFPMVQEELLSLRVRFEAGALLAFESALAFDAALEDPEKRAWLRFTTALAKYLTAEDAIRAARSALELIGGNGYTSDYPIARILRDAQVLTVWEGPANIQALELLRVLTTNDAAALYRARIEKILAQMNGSRAALHEILEARLKQDSADIALVTANSQNGERYARKLLHRLSQSFALALLCEAAAEDREEKRLLAALRYAEEIAPPKIGSENQQVRAAASALLCD